MLQQQRILVTGASGFLGTHVVRDLAAQGHEVTALASDVARPLAGARRLYRLRLPDSLLSDILAAERPDWVVHCAGGARVDRSCLDPGADYHDNVSVTSDLLARMTEHSPRTGLVFLSSAAVYGEPDQLPIDELAPTRPISPYGRHKLECERLCQDHFERTQATAVVLRGFSIYGPGLKKQLLWDVFWQSRHAGPIVLGGSGLEQRDLIFVDDVTRLIAELVARPRLGCSVLNVGSGAASEIRQIVSQFLAALGIEREVCFSGLTRPGYPARLEADTHRLAGRGFHATTSLERGLAVYARWLLASEEKLRADRLLARAG